MDCQTCRDLQLLLTQTSREWALATQVAEVSRAVPELSESFRVQIDTAHFKHDLVLRAVADHEPDCAIVNAARAKDARADASKGEAYKSPRRQFLLWTAATLLLHAMCHNTGHDKFADLGSAGASKGFAE
jgi:hypothetical protein